MPAETSLLYFAAVRERIGCGEERLVLPPGIDRVDRLIGWLVGRGVEYAAAFERRDRVRCAVNQALVHDDAAIADGDEVAFFPPMTGG